jgi:ABC-type polysaccharide/polyol phosphate export permease
MFRQDTHRTKRAGAFAMLELIFHSAVRNIRKSNGNAVLGLVISIVQSLLMVLVFLFMMTYLGGGNRGIRGDMLLYVMSGVFLFMTHTKTISAVAKSDGPTSAMMKHSPMNPIVAIAAAALSTLYQQILSIVVILFFYHAIFTPITIDQPVGAFMMLLLAWASGIAIGMIFKAATPWAPEFFGIATNLYSRINMIASGKMFVANATPTWILAWFWWNPLFHVIDQSRGFIFLNYEPHYSSISYPVKVTIALFMIGLMLENYTRRYASASWGAK